MTDSTRPTPEFDTIFDQCLRDVLRGARTIDDCLQQYPDYADELKPALQTGLLAARLKSPEMSAASVDALENRLRQQMGASTKPKVIQGRFTPFARLAAMIAIVFLITLGSGAGAVAASSNAVPGDFLYGLKRLWEAIILALTPLTGQVDDLWLQIAETRLDELEELAKRGQLTDSMLIDLYSSMAQAITLADVETRPALLNYLHEAQQSLTALQPPPAYDQLYADIILLTAPIVRPDGSLLPPAAAPPSLEIAVTPTLSPTATLTQTPTAEQRNSPTAVLMQTEETTATLTSTPTPRVPATATRTPVPSATPTATYTPSATPSATWTPLPLPTLPGSTPVTQPTHRPASPDPRVPTNTPDANATVRIRETEQSVYMTQTAGPPPTSPP